MKNLLNKIFYLLIFLASSTLYLNAQCTTSAGSFTSTEPVQLCDGDCANIITHAGDENLDANDILEFVIFKPSNPTQILARKSSPDFCYSEILPNGEYGTTYHIAARAGNNAGGSGIVDPSDPCMDQSVAVPVAWFQTPIAHISQSTTTFCGNSGFLKAEAPQSGLTGTWSSSVDFVPSNGTINSNEIDITVGETGTHTFTWTIVNGPCPASASIELEFIQQPNAYAGANQTICGNQISLEGIQSVPGSTANWTGNGNFASSTSFETEVSGGVFGPVIFTLRESVGICWDEASVTITFIQDPNPVITNTYDTVCGNTANLKVLNVVGSGTWVAYDSDDIIINPAPNYTNGVNSSNTNVTIGAYPQNELSKTVKFVWTEVNSANGITCTNSVTKYVTFSRKPVASVGASNEGEVCGSTFQLAADITGSEWANGRWISPYINNPFDDPHLPNATISIPVPASYGDSAYVKAPFVWAMTNTGCVSIDTMWVTFYQRPQANAGLDKSVCGFDYDLEAFWGIPPSPSYEPSGLWSAIPQQGESANFVDKYDPNSHVTVSATTVWQFVFRENNSNLTSCYSTDTVEITFIETPIATAGPDKHVCGKVTNLEGIGGGHNGTWLSNGTSIQDYTNPNTTVTSSTYGAIPFVWLESNEFCSMKDTVIITFWREPEAKILTDEADSTVCGLRFNNLRAEAPGQHITGYWYTINPYTIIGELGSNHTWAQVPNYGYHDFYWIEETGPGLTPGFCNDTAGPLRIHFIEVPKANAGGDTLFCGKNGYLNAIPSVGTGVWSTPTQANINIENQNDPNSYIESAIINTGHPTTPYFTLIWTEDNTNGCTDKDTIKVVFARVPSSEIKIIPPKCFGEYATIAAAEDTLQQYTWNFYAGIYDSVTYNPMGGRYQNFVRWNSTDTLHRISLVASNYWECQSAVTVDTVFEPKIPEFEHIIINDTCALGKGGIIFLDTLGSNAFFWIDPEYGPEPGTPFTSVYNIPAGEYDVGTAYQTPNLTHYAYYNSTFGSANCLDTATYEIIPIGMIMAKIALSPDIIFEELVAPNANVIFVNSSEYDNIGKKCEWHFGDGTSPHKSCDEFVEHTYTKGGCYEPFLIVMNRDLVECRDTAWLDECIPVDESSEIEVPNVFSPNGDGINDFFQVKAKTLKEFNG
ncbi:MAG: gliding motility-associated C-terminal domain-containing protein, partial [Bacteroidales bacterium]|nr:gliding motility-associated C-terminal domain-containing protein [Bacteroidales bacterium]